MKGCICHFAKWQIHITLDMKGCDRYTVSYPRRIIPLDMKGCIYHFTKWQIHLFISKETIICGLLRNTDIYAVVRPRTFKTAHVNRRPPPWVSARGRRGAVEEGEGVIAPALGAARCQGTRRPVWRPVGVPMTALPWQRSRRDEPVFTILVPSFVYVITRTLRDIDPRCCFNARSVHRRRTNIASTPRICYDCWNLSDIIFFHFLHFEKSHPYNYRSCLFTGKNYTQIKKYL